MIRDRVLPNSDVPRATDRALTEVDKSPPRVLQDMTSVLCRFIAETSSFRVLNFLPEACRLILLSGLAGALNQG